MDEPAESHGFHANKAAWGPRAQCVFIRHRRSCAAYPVIVLVSGYCAARRSCGRHLFWTDLSSFHGIDFAVPAFRTAPVYGLIVVLDSCSSAGILLQGTRTIVTCVSFDSATWRWPLVLSTMSNSAFVFRNLDLDVWIDVFMHVGVAALAALARLPHQHVFFGCLWLVVLPSLFRPSHQVSHTSCLPEAAEIPFQLLPSVGNMMLPLPARRSPPPAVCRAVEATVA